MKWYFSLLLLFELLIFLLAVVSIANAQPGDPGGDPDNVVPISGLETLIVLGSLLGAGSIFNSKRKKQ